MAVHDFRSQRLFVRESLVKDQAFEISREQANYLLNVLRLGDGSDILVFNGRDGEWQCSIRPQGRKKCHLLPLGLSRGQPKPNSLTYCFAPLKQARLDYMVQKAVEMGVGILQPVITQHTQVRSMNLKRVEANAIEAAEQCGILTIPEIREPVSLQELPLQLTPETTLFFCDEAHGDQISISKEKPTGNQTIALLIGPEGGFSNQERTLIQSWKNIKTLGLGPRILRADTAAVAALTLIQSKIGDWKESA
ncbi:MAG: 16S rRNA (uracil(1498)-N(3))-methyltransferase [Pseudomonadota bacterium]